MSPPPEGRPRSGLQIRIAWLKAQMLTLATLIQTAFLAGMTGPSGVSPRSFARDTRAAFSVGSTNSLVMVIIGAIVAVLVVAALAGLFFSSIADLNAELDTVETNSTVGNTIAGVFPIVIAVAAVLGLVGIVLTALKFGGKFS